MRSPRIARMRASSTLSRSSPANNTSPASIRPGGSGTRRSSESAVTVLPEPDSPTSASVSPALTSNETSSTAVTSPRSVRKRVVSPRTWSKGSVTVASQIRNSEPHLLLQVLIDPDARVNRAGPIRACPQLAAVVLDPWPPSGIHIRRRQPDIRRLLQNLTRHFPDHHLAFFFVAFLVNGAHFFVELGIGVLRRIPRLLAYETLADRGGRIGDTAGEEVAGRVGLGRHRREERTVLHGLDLHLHANLLQVGSHQRQQTHVVGVAGADLHLEAEAVRQTRFSFKVQVCTCTPDHMDLLPLVAAYLEKVGVKVEIQPMEYGAFLSAMTTKTNAPGYFLASGVTNPTTSIRKSFVTKQTWNPSQYSDPEFDKRMADVYLERDESKRQLLIKLLTRDIVEKAPYIWLPTAYVYSAWWPWVKNYDGELRVGSERPGPIHARIWIDQELKKKMGY